MEFKKQAKGKRERETNQETDSWSAWVAQSVECLTLHFSSGRDPRVMRSIPVLGSILSVESAFSPSAPLPHLHSLSLSKQTNKQINKQTKQQQQNPRLLTIENKLMVTREEVGGRMGEVGDGD